MRPPRDVADHMIRESLGDSANLEDFLRAAVPEVVDHLDFSQVRPVPREFFSQDWHGREADLLFEIPWRDAPGKPPVLVCLLIEHQSDTDPLVPLRTLYITVSYWERRWRQWEQLARPRPDLVLPVVLPIVLYTADVVWGSNTNLRQLVRAPEALQAYVPDWGPLFWSLAGHSAEKLLAGGPWTQFLAVLRVKPEEEAAFRTVFTQALERLRQLRGREHVRWSELLRIVLTFALWRRPGAERQQLIELAATTTGNPKAEVRQMGQTIAEALIAEGEERGEERGRLLGAREQLRFLLEKKYGALPETIVQRLEALEDLKRINDLAFQTQTAETLDDLRWGSARKRKRK